MICQQTNGKRRNPLLLLTPVAAPSSEDTAAPDRRVQLHTSLPREGAQGEVLQRCPSLSQSPLLSSSLLSLSSTLRALLVSGALLTPPAGFCKLQLWPLFHYNLPLSPLSTGRFNQDMWQAYVKSSKVLHLPRLPIQEGSRKERGMLTRG